MFHVGKAKRSFLDDSCAIANAISNTWYESGLDELRVSLDSSSPETYLKVRGIPAFERVTSNLAQMVQTRRSLRSGRMPFTGSPER